MNDPMAGYVENELGMVAPREGVTGQLRAENEALKVALKAVVKAYDATGYSPSDVGYCRFCDKEGIYMHAPDCAWEQSQRLV